SRRKSRVANRIERQGVAVSRSGLGPAALSARVRPAPPAESAMSPTLLVTHDACARHDTGHWHPESPARLAAVLQALAGPGFAGLERAEAPRATAAQLGLAHPAAFVERALAAVPQT